MNEPDLIEASPCKLRSGDWGCKTAEPVNVGDTVRIVTRANKQWSAQITKIVWTDDQTCICETASEKSKKTGVPQDSAEGQPASRNSGAKPKEPLSTNDEHVPAPPRSDAIATDELDAMADAAAEQNDEFDDVMNAMAEFDKGGRE